MLSEPVWRALLNALSTFSSLFPPVSKLKPSLGTKDILEILTVLQERCDTPFSGDDAEDQGVTASSTVPEGNLL